MHGNDAHHHLPVNRKQERRSLPYFFGILRNVQQRLDDEAKHDYCRDRYNFHVMRKLELQKAESLEQETMTVEKIVELIGKGVAQRSLVLKNVSLRMAWRWAQKIKAAYQNMGVLKSKLEGALYQLDELTLAQRKEALEIIGQFMDPVTGEACVTQFS